MIVDTSALVAIAFGETDARLFADRLASSVAARIASPNWVEACIVVEARGDRASVELLSQLIGRHLQIARFGARHALAAIDIWRRFGRGRHPARLNYGDCMAYGFAKVEGEPLLFKGIDFSQTDITPALA